MRRDLSKPKGTTRGELKLACHQLGTDCYRAGLSPGLRPAAMPQLWAAVPQETCLAGGR